jgi:putative Mn2+ efflux pump MntP|tara:strand:- start:1422 stop:1607 length:186 start_codon:yes stop_codon:yes gene_type:complete
VANSNVDFWVYFFECVFRKEVGVFLKTLKTLKTLDVFKGIVFIGIGLNILFSHLFDHGFLA